MVYTLTLNPSLDYVVAVENFQVGKTNRTKEEQIYPGGKGLNVSVVLKNLDIESTALGFVAGFTGEELIKRVEKLGISNGFIKVTEGNTRINVKLKNYEGTEINGIGPAISSASMAELKEKLEKVKSGDVVVLAGSVPASVSKDIYSSIMEELKVNQKKQILFVVDTTKELLLNCLQYEPFLIKPNNHELGEIFGVDIATKESAIEYGILLQERGARNVMISMAGQGAVLLTEDGKQYMKEAPKGVYVNGVGAGDSMIAGFLAGWEKYKNYEEAFELAIASGSATAFSEYLGDGRRIIELLETMKQE